jgi:hypothetical protein
MTMPCIHFDDGKYVVATVVLCRVEGCETKIRIEVSGKDTEHAAKAQWGKVVSAAVELAGALGWPSVDECNLHKEGWRP